MSNYVYPNLFIIFVFYAILFASFYGWGTLALTILKINLQSIPGRFFTTAWIGWAAILLVMQVFHLFLPLDWRVSAFVYLSGLVAGCFKISIYLRDLLRSKNYKPIDVVRVVLFFCLILLAARWAAFKGMGEVTNYDSGLYHFNNIRWINSYPIIPGLGNLHGRLAFNQSFFLYVASLNFFPYFPFGHVIANSFLFLLAFADLTWHLYGLTQRRDRGTLFNIFFLLPYLFGLAIILYISVFTNMASPTPDVASSILQTVLYIWFIQIIDDVRNQKFPNDKISSLFIVATTLITVKLSNLVFVASLMAICLFYIVPRILKVSANGTGYLRVFVFLVATILVWMIRGIFSSGYPVYPVAIGGLNVDWAVPVEKTRFEADSIYSWARLQGRNPSKVLGNWDWLRPWLSRTYRKYKSEIIYPVLLAAVFGLMTLLLAPFRNNLRRIYLNSIFPIPIVTGILFWFYMAPDPRFAHALFLLLPCSAFLVLMSCVYQLTGEAFGTALNIGVFMIFIFYLLPINELRELDFTAGYQTIPSSALTEKKTDSGLMVYIPLKGDQCWDAPLPCTPYFNSELRLRVPGKITSGFTQK